MPESFGFCDKDRYGAALPILLESGDDFFAMDGHKLPDAVRQTGCRGPRVPFVCSGNENAVYYAPGHDSENVRTHCFEQPERRR